ncbi:hypothetical protein KOR42_13440 [Thalassoglobus neptunius]|uniref:DUF58 domain-containing protein n=1 Tax=Thalassoglobus neptunius TaxID=1938619 RepID=A0A5C5X4P7_9PLAN|nr:DUF58 domain-containing protein [Thalassoglobus neptunius]TWT57976.1 hypothetical protein KOR42_13440 [Thalassoglobus neptunius]
MKRQQPFLIRLTKFLVGFKLTPIGRVAVLGIFLSAIGAVTVEIPIYQIFCGLVAFFGLIELTGILLRPKVDVKVWLPDRVTAGESVTGYLTITNLGWLPACDIMCVMFGLPGGLRHVDADRSIQWIGVGETDTLPFTIEAKSRGEYLLPEIRVHSTFPFNLMRFGKAKAPQLELLVVPAFEPIGRYSLPFSRKFQVGGVTVDSQIGQSTEFVGNREYVPGEPARKLDFKAWARVGHPVVREFQDEVTSDVALILDVFRPTEWRRFGMASKQLETAVSLTAAIAHSLDQHQSSVEVFGCGPDLYLFQPSAQGSHFESILQILAVTQRNRYDSFSQLTEAMTEPLESTAVAICIFLTWNPEREHFLRMMYESGIGVRCYLVVDARDEIMVPDDLEVAVIDPKDPSALEGIE